MNAEDATVGSDATLLHEGNVAELGQSDTVPTPIIENADGNITEPVQQLLRSTRLRKEPERYGIQDDKWPSPWGENAVKQISCC